MFAAAIKHTTPILTRKGIPRRTQQLMGKKCLPANAREPTDVARGETFEDRREELVGKDSKASKSIWSAIPGLELGGFHGFEMERFGFWESS